MLNSIQIKNYKCFWETERIGFSPSWNIIIGKNNVGKSSLLSALSLVDVQNSPYRGISTPRNATQNPHSILKFEFSISGIDLKRSLLSSDTKFQWQWHRQMSNMRHSDFEELHNTFNKLLSDGSIIVSGAHTMSQGLSFNGVTTGGGLQIQPGILTSCFSSTRDRQSIVFEANGPAYNQNYLGQLLSQNYVPSFYLFKAERMHIGEAPISTDSVLMNTAQNLAAVINNLRENPSRFNRFVRLIQEIIPEITNIIPAVSRQQKNHVEVMIATADPTLERDDLNIKLQDSGTGISQILAILYVVVNSDSPRTIVIDEPNSFLHPGAAKQLIRILKRFPQHQYILSTHSTDLIQTAEPENIISIEWKNSGSIVKTLNRKSFNDLRYMLSEMGAQLSDVLGPDKIVWVEGPTEENCFPLLLKAAKTELPPHVSFVALRATGDLTGKHKKVFYEMYERQTTAIGIVPIAIAYNLDSEGLTSRDKEDLSRASKNRIKFLPRRTYENYLLKPDAISALLIRLGIQTDTELVTQWITENGGKAEYFSGSQWNKNLADAAWVRDVNAAGLLESLFSDFTNTAFEYKKIEFGVELTSWLLEHDAGSIQELTDYVVDLVRTDT